MAIKSLNTETASDYDSQAAGDIITKAETAVLELVNIVGDPKLKKYIDSLGHSGVSRSFKRFAEAVGKTDDAFSDLDSDLEDL